MARRGLDRQNPNTPQSAQRLPLHAACAVLLTQLGRSVKGRTVSLPFAMKNDQTLRFNYKLSIGNALLMVVLAAAVTAGMGYFAHVNPNVRVTRILAQLFSPEAPPLIYWGLTVLGLIATLYVTFMAVKSTKAVNYVELGPQGAVLPSATISMSLITISYRSIKSVQLAQLGKHQMAVISSSEGQARLSSQFFPTPSDFKTFLAALEQRRHTRQSSASPVIREQVVRQRSLQPSFPTRAKALACVIHEFQELLYLKPYSHKIYRHGQAYEIPSDGSRIVVIKTETKPVTVSTYERYSEPGNPVWHREYRSLEAFVFGFFEVDTQRLAKHMSRAESGFPSQRGEPYSVEKMDHFLAQMKVNEELLRQVILKKIAEKPFVLLERYIWRDARQLRTTGMSA